MFPILNRIKIKDQVKNSQRATHFTLVYASLLLSTLCLNSCTNLPVEKSAKNSNEIPIEAEFIYKYLVAEVAGQRGEFATSSAIFYDLAQTTRESSLAERAAKTAAYGNVPSLTIPAIKLWTELDPSSNEAQQAMTEVLIATGKFNEAKPYLAKLFTKEESRAVGFLYINSMLGKSTDKAGVLDLIQSLAAPYPKLAEAQLAIAQAAIAAHQNKIAIKALNQAELLKPGWDIAAILKGQVLFEESPQVTLKFYRDFLKKYPSSNEVRLNLARLLVNQKEFEAAKLEYPTILKNAKNNAEVFAVIGLLSYQSTDYVEAEGYFQQSLAAGFKDTSQLYIYLAQVSEKLNHDDTASTWYSKVQPGQHYLEAQIYFANLIARTQSVDKAIEKLDAIDDLETEQQIIVIQTEASLLAKEKRDKESFELLDKAIKNLPNTPELVYDYALSAERVDKFDIMEMELRKTITAKPDFADAYNALGYSFADRNVKLDEAVELIEKALSLSPNNTFMLDSLGWAHYRKGNLTKAIKYLKQAYNASQDPEIAAHLGEALWQQGKYDEAKKIWDDALIANPKNETLISVTSKFKS